MHESLEELRRIARELRPEALDDLGLVNALIALCSRVDVQGRPAGAPRARAGACPRCREETELVIYRVAQESLTNALRHAEAGTATRRADRRLGAVTLTVTDDGQGMPGRIRRRSPPASRACASGPCWSAAASRSDPRPARGPRYLTVPVEGEGR